MGQASITIHQKLLQRLLDEKYAAQIKFKRIAQFDEHTYFCEVEAPELLGNCGVMDVVIRDDDRVAFKTWQPLWDEV